MRCDEQTEILGVDDAEMGEFAYDYVGLEQELGQTVNTTLRTSSRSSNEKVVPVAESQ